MTPLPDTADLPPGAFMFDTPIVVAGGKSLTGAGPNLTTLTYTGDPALPAIVVPRQSWGFTLSGFNLVGSGVGTGVRIGGDQAGGFGTQASGTVESVWVSGFARGVHVGDILNGTAASECIFRKVVAQYCDVGVRLEDPNTLNTRLEQFGASDCHVGLQTLHATNTRVLGGSATRVGTLWQIAGGGTYTLRDYRTEGCGPLVDIANTLARTNVNVSDCETNGNTHPKKWDIIARAGAHVRVLGGTLSGVCYYEGVNGAPPYGAGGIDLDGVGIIGDHLMETAFRNSGRWSARRCVLLAPDGSVRRVVGDSAGQWLNFVRFPAQ